jgi:hypothetical protein
MEFLWVILNYIGIERTTTEPIVEYVGDIHLAYMPFSHSILTMVLAGIVAWTICLMAGRARLGAAVGLGIVSHLVLDLITHNGDIALAPFAGAGKYGTYLYAAAPAAAFMLELGFGLLCWWIFRGGKALLAIIVGFNLANASLFFKAVPGPEHWMANRPLLIVTVISVQIIVTLAAVGWAAARSRPQRTEANGSAG